MSYKSKEVKKPKMPEKVVKVWKEKRVSNLKSIIELSKKLGINLEDMAIRVENGYNYYNGYPRAARIYARWFTTEPNANYNKQLKKYKEDLKNYVAYMDKKVDKSAKEYEKTVKEHNEAMQALLNKSEAKANKTEKK